VLPLFPARILLVGTVPHDFTTWVYESGEKARLRNPPLPQPEVTLAGQEPVAEYASKQRHTKIYRLNKMPVIGHQHLLDMIGIIKDINGKAKETEAHHIAVLAGKCHQIIQRVPHILRQVASNEMPSRAGQIKRSGHNHLSFRLASPQFYHSSIEAGTPYGQWP